MLLAAYLTSAFLVSGVSAWYLLRGREIAFARHAVAEARVEPDRRDQQSDAIGAEDAQQIDTTDLRVEDVVERIEEMVRARSAV